MIAFWYNFVPSKNPSAFNSLYFLSETPYSDPDGDSTAGNYIGVYTEKPEKKTVQLVIDKLEVNETQTIEYELRVKNLADNEETKTVETNFILKINGIAYIHDMPIIVNILNILKNY